MLNMCKFLTTRCKTTGRIALAALGLTALSACASIDPVGSPENQLPDRALAADEFNWPPQYEPEKATFYVTNEIIIDASPETIWEVLIEASAWEDWYDGGSNLNLLNAPSGKLALGAVFTWRTMSNNFRSEVKEFEPPYRLGWETRKSTMVGYHPWLLIPLEDGRTKVVTDEAQYGLLANLQRIFIPNSLPRVHDRWLLGLKERAEAREQAMKL